MMSSLSSEGLRCLASVAFCIFAYDESSLRPFLLPLNIWYASEVFDAFVLDLCL